MGIKEQNHKVGWLKIHVELNSADDAPMYSNITHPNVNDIVDARTNIEIQKVLHML